MDGWTDIETDGPIYGQTKREMDTHLFSQPTSSMPWGRRSAIWDPGGPHQTPQTAIHTPKVTYFKETYDKENQVAMGVCMVV